MPASPLSRTRVEDGVPAHHQTVDDSDPRMHIFSERRYTYIHMGSSVRNKLFGEFARSQPAEGGARPEWPRISFLGVSAKLPS